MSTYHNHSVLQADPYQTTQTVATPWTEHEGWLTRDIMVSHDGMERVMGDADYLTFEDEHGCMEYHGDMVTTKSGHTTYVISVWVWNLDKLMEYRVQQLHAQFTEWAAHESKVTV